MNVKVGADTTFQAAPLVAGVIAGFLALGQISMPLDWEQLTDFLYNKASWRRGENGEYVIWNMVDKAHNEPIPPSGNATVSNLTASFYESNVPGIGQFNLTTN